MARGADEGDQRMSDVFFHQHDGLFFVKGGEGEAERGGVAGTRLWGRILNPSGESQ